jgi:hypothetical protein
MRIKYIVLENYPVGLSGFTNDVMFVFPEMVDHKKFADKLGYRVISAGFIRKEEYIHHINGNINDDSLENVRRVRKHVCYGESISLGIKSDPKIDTLLYKIQYGRK